jgi:RHS repeat-associated protein
MVKPNAQGTEAVLVARYDYDVYGAVRTQSGSSANRFKYVAGIGHPTDEETGLIYMRARYYEPGTGRFVSEDPARHDANWYVYARNSPTNNFDTDGRMSGIVVAGMVGALMGLGLYWGFSWALGRPITLAGSLEALFLGALGGVGVYLMGLAALKLGWEAIGSLINSELVGIDIGLAGVGAFDVGAVLGMLGGAGVKVVVYVISLVFSLAMVDSDTLELRHED